MCSDNTLYEEICLELNEAFTLRVLAQRHYSKRQWLWVKTSLDPAVQTLSFKKKKKKKMTVGGEGI